MDNPRPRRLSPQQQARRLETASAETWKAFYHGPGRAAIAHLMTEFGMYAPMPSQDPYHAMRREGQRDVLLRIVQLIGLKPEDIPTDVWDDNDILERMMR